MPGSRRLVKVCFKCKKEYSTDNFNRHSRSSSGYDCWCKPCRRKYTNNRRKKRVKWFADLKRNIPCKDCGKIYEPYCMDYDHLYDKIQSVSRMVLENVPKKRIFKEIEKCELVCVLCHNDRTLARSDKKNKYSKHVTRNIEIINKSKEKPCAICNIQYGSHNMQFDHIDPTTKFANVCQLKRFKVKTLQAEIDKCQVVCALCHRRKSILELRQGKYKSRPEEDVKKVYVDDTSRECVRCNKILSFDHFSKHKKTKSGYNSWCKPCFNKYRRERRAKETNKII